jgi:3-methyl-2-oxobutanoate hydroxymethyltransferase
VTTADLQQMKRDGRKIVGVVVYDYQMAQIVDRAGVDIVSVGDSVGKNVWGRRAISRSRSTRCCWRARR